MKLEFIFQHPESKEFKSKIVALDRILQDGLTIDEIKDNITCNCQPVGETNVVDCNCGDYYDEFQLVEKRVHTGTNEKLGQRMEWVSVAERLPENSNEVDAWVRTSLGDVHRIPNLKFVKDHWEVYYDEVDRFEPLNSFYTVTHWMPLPPNPGEVELCE